jgi:hypothetical protein
MYALLELNDRASYHLQRNTLVLNYHTLRNSPLIGK